MSTISVVVLAIMAPAMFMAVLSASAAGRALAVHDFSRDALKKADSLRTFQGAGLVCVVSLFVACICVAILMADMMTIN